MTATAVPFHPLSPARSFGAMRQKLTALGWIAGLAVAGFALLRLGELDGMSVQWADLGSWLRTTDLESALAAIARAAGLALVAWTGVSTVVYALARLFGARRSALEWLSIPPLRRAMDALLAGSLLLNMAAPGLAAEPAPGGASAAQETVHPAYVPVPAGPERRPSPPTADRTPAPPAADAPRESLRVVVEHGDNMWMIAERHLAEVLGRPPTDGETTPYWKKLVGANRERIRSGDPDLIFPGEEIVLPEA